LRRYSEDTKFRIAALELRASSFGQAPAQAEQVLDPCIHWPEKALGPHYFAAVLNNDGFWPIAAPDVCDGTSAVGESRHRIPGASVGQPTEPCFKTRVLTNRDCGASYSMSAMPR